jgi:hypothetical protein
MRQFDNVCADEVVVIVAPIGGFVYATVSLVVLPTYDALTVEGTAKNGNAAVPLVSVIGPTT